MYELECCLLKYTKFEIRYMAESDYFAFDSFYCYTEYKQLYCN